MDCCPCLPTQLRCCTGQVPPVKIPCMAATPEVLSVGRRSLADVIMLFRNMITAISHSVLAKGCTCVQVCKITHT